MEFNSGFKGLNLVVRSNHWAVRVKL